MIWVRDSPDPIRLAILDTAGLHDIDAVYRDIGIEEGWLKLETMRRDHHDTLIFVYRCI